MPPLPRGTAPDQDYSPLEHSQPGRLPIRTISHKNKSPPGQGQLSTNHPNGELSWWPGIVLVGSCPSGELLLSWFGVVFVGVILVGNYPGESYPTWGLVQWEVVLVCNYCQLSRSYLIICVFFLNVIGVLNQMIKLNTTAVREILQTSG